MTFLILHHFPVGVLPVVPYPFYPLCPLRFAVSYLPNAPLVDPRDSPARISGTNGHNGYNGENSNGEMMQNEKCYFHNGETRKNFTKI